MMGLMTMAVGKDKVDLSVYDLHSVTRYNFLAMIPQNKVNKSS